MALTAIRCGAQNSVAIGGTSDITGLEVVSGSVQNDRTGPRPPDFAVLHNAVSAPRRCGRFGPSI
jgi:hypothetical protein